MCSGIFSACCLYEHIGSPGTEVVDNCELPCECLELNPGRLDDQPVLLTTYRSPQIFIATSLNKVLGVIL